MSTSVMSEYQVGRRNFPLTLYRVDYPESQTTYSRQRGFEAASDFRPRQITGLRNAVAYHLNWRSTVLSPFISTFSNRQHAVNWARVWSENHDQEPCNIVEIRIGAGDGVAVFRVTNLVNRLGVSTSLDPSQYQSEYLCFLRIPSRAIVREESVSYEREDSYSDSDDDYY